MVDRRLPRLHGGRTAVRRPPPRAPPSTSAAATNMRWRGRAARSSTRRRLRPAAAGHRLVRRVRGSEPAAGERRLSPRTRRVSWARPSIRRRFTASTLVRRMLDDNGLTTARISAHVARLAAPAARCDRRHGVRRGRAAQSARRATARALPRLPQPERAALVSRADGANCITDVRGDVLRIGFGIYQDEGDVDAAGRLAGEA